MSFTDYPSLQTAVLNWLARPGDPLVSASLPDMITLFEEEARDRMVTRFSEVDTTIATVANSPTVALPAMFLEARELELIGTPNQTLIYMSPEEMDEAWPLSSQTQAPINFTIIGTNFRFGPVPDAVYTIRVVYQQGIPALSNGSPTNWLLANYPSTYLYGTLAEATGFIGDDDIALWIKRRDAAFARILTRDQKVRWSGNALQIKTDTGNP